jgi:hypothetical protein
MFSNKNSHGHIKKLVKTLMEFFQKFVTLTENPINFDVTYSVLLGTVRVLNGVVVEYQMIFVVVSLMFL